MTPPDTFNPHHADRLLFGGLLGLSVAAVFQLLEDRESVPLTVASYAFAAAVPLLAGCLIAEMDRVRKPNPAPPTAGHAVVGILAALTALAGLAACFWHLGPGPGGLFLGSSVLALVLARTVRR